MKPIVIEFVPRTAWRWIWIVSLLLLLGLISFTAWQWRHASRINSLNLRALEDVKLQLAADSRKEPPPVDPRTASLQKVRELLGRNLNDVFTTAENIKEPGTKLKNLSYDAVANTVRLNYELDSMVRTASITALLNAGNEAKPWTLDSATASIAVQTGTATNVRATWIGRISDF